MLNLIFGIIIAVVIAIVVYFLLRNSRHQEDNLPAVSEDVNLPAVSESNSPMVNKPDLPVQNESR